MSKWFHQKENLKGIKLKKEEEIKNVWDL